tara:strand:+ start:94 stop:195 length:102 start_codon:yes stop_codon:yes gene_type:complete
MLKEKGFASVNQFCAKIPVKDRNAQTHIFFEEK